MKQHTITVTIEVDDTNPENTQKMLDDLSSAIDSEVQEFEAWMDHGIHPEENDQPVKRGHGGFTGPFVESYSIKAEQDSDAYPKAYQGDGSEFGGASQIVVNEATRKAIDAMLRSRGAKLGIPLVFADGDLPTYNLEIMDGVNRGQ